MKENFYSKSVKMAQETDRIIDVANRVGLKLPSSHTALFQAVYSPIEESNNNGVRLARHAVEKALPRIILAQCNFEHMREGFMNGLILDAWINEANEIEIIFSFAKNLYPELFERAVHQLEAGTLSVSFELTTDPSSKEFLEDGTVRLHDIDFDGVGLLLDNQPAYPGASVYQFAKDVKNRVDSIMESDLVLASQIKSRCNEIINRHEELEDNKDKTQGGNKKMDEEQKKMVAELREELGEFAKDVKDEELLNEDKVKELREAKEEAEAKAEEENELEEAKKKIEELEAKVAELEGTLEAKDSEIEEVAKNAAKVAKLKIELKDNTYVADFKDEDYLDEAKVEEAKRKFELDQREEAVKQKEAELEEARKKAEAAESKSEKKTAKKEDDSEEKEEMQAKSEEEDEDKVSYSQAIEKLRG